MFYSPRTCSGFKHPACGRGSEPWTGSDRLEKMERFDPCLHGKGESSCLRDGAMAKSESLAVLRDIHTLFHVGSSNGLTEAQLLDRFRRGPT